MADLCTVQQVVDWSGNSVPLNPSLATLVTGVSAAIESMLNRTFAVATYTETRNGHGRRAMMVRNDPIISVASVSVNGVAIAPRTTPTACDGYVFDSDTIYLSGRCFDGGVQNIVFVYQGGFTTTPADIVQATIEAVAFLAKEKEHTGLASKAMGGETTAYIKDLPPHLLRRFQQFARIATPP